MMMHGTANPKFTGQIRIKNSTQHSLEIFHTVQPILVSIIFTHLYLHTCVYSAVLAQGIIPIFVYIFGQESVALCELIVKDDLFQLVEVFVPGF
jgi:hypothetical protein